MKNTDQLTTTFPAGLLDKARKILVEQQEKLGYPTTNINYPLTKFLTDFIRNPLKYREIFNPEDEE